MRHVFNNGYRINTIVDALEKVQCPLQWVANEHITMSLLSLSLLLNIKQQTGREYCLSNHTFLLLFDLFVTMRWLV